MESAPTDFHRYQFAFPQHDTALQVEVRDDDVVIRATRDSLTEERKASFIHELASEGFIPDDYLWYSPYGGRRTGRTILWKIDPFWPGESAPESHRRLVYIQALSYSALILALFMGLLFTGNLGNLRLGSYPTTHHEAAAALLAP